MTSRSRNNHYRVLGVERDASPGEIKRAYRALARRYHPDHNPGDGAAEVRFREISAAYATLSDPQARKEYDSSFVAADAVSTRAFRAPSRARTGVRRFHFGFNVRVAGTALPLGGISLSIDDSEMETLRAAARRALRELIDSIE
jgi:curved DNA-binding protein CbpA